MKRRMDPPTPFPPIHKIQFIPNLKCYVWHTSDKHVYRLSQDIVEYVLGQMIDLDICRPEDYTLEELAKLLFEETEYEQSQKKHTI